MVDEPLSLGKLPPKTGTNFRWTLLAFVLAGGLISALVIWQLYETTPRVWCEIASDAASERFAGCGPILIALIGVKDHAIIGLLTILGMTIAAVVVVALGVSIKGSGPGGMSIDVGREKTTASDGESQLTIPTPPSG